MRYGYLRACAVLLACCAAVPCRGEIYEPTAMPAEPSQVGEFKPIAVPKWVEDLPTVCYTLSAMPGAMREELAAAGGGISEVGFVDPTHVYYESKFLKNRSPHRPADYIEKEIADYDRLGLKILGIYPPTLQGEVYHKHPEWRRIATNTTEIPNTTDPVGGSLCPIGPYSDFMIEILAEIATKFPQVDAFSFDGIHHGGVCYCASCRENYRKETGKEIPDLDMKNPEFRRYQHWADRRMEQFVQRMQVRLKGINPELAVITWTTNAGRYGHFLSIPRNMPARLNLLFDAVDQEFWMDETNRGGTVVAAFANAYMWAVTNHRAAFSTIYPMTHGNPYGVTSFPLHEYVLRQFQIMTWGPQSSLAPAFGGPIKDATLAVLQEINKRKEYMVHKRPEPYAAILMSDNTNNFYGGTAGATEERYLANVLGMFRACIEEHIPVEIICDWNLTAANLGKYKVVMLPNSACISDAGVAAIREYVSAGGGLISSADASLYDEYGDGREDFALSDVFGVHYRTELTSTLDTTGLDPNFAKVVGADYIAKARNAYTYGLVPGGAFDFPEVKPLNGPEPLRFKGPANFVVMGNDRATTLSTITAIEPGKQIFAGAVLNTVGQGKSVYLAAALDHGYYMYPYPYYRYLLKRAIGLVASGPQPTVVTAPKCVQTSTMRQDTPEGRERLVVHLFNNVNTTANHAYPIDDVPLREETIPIHDIKVAFRAENIARVHLQPEGTELAVTKNAEGLSEVTVPKLDMHSMVVAELK